MGWLVIKVMILKLHIQNFFDIPSSKKRDATCVFIWNVKTTISIFIKFYIGVLVLTSGMRVSSNRIIKNKLFIIMDYFVLKILGI